MGLTPAHEASPATDLPVRVSQTTVLEPGTETFVPCETTCILSAPLMLVAQRSALADKSLMVSPAVINSGRCRLLVSNPTDRTEVLYKDQAIAFAVRLAESDDGTFYCPHATTSETVHMDAVAVDAGPATPSQATLSFDLTQASITEAEKQILRDLFSEYRDRFSLSAYDLGSYDHTEIDIKTTTDVPPMKFRPPRIPEAATEDRSLAAIGYFSKTLSESQRKWSTVHIELFAMLGETPEYPAFVYDVCMSSGSPGTGSAADSTLTPVVNEPRVEPGPSTEFSGHVMASSLDLSAADAPALRRDSSSSLGHAVASTDQSVSEASRNSTTLESSVAVPMDTADMQRESAASFGHVVAATDLSCISTGGQLTPRFRSGGFDVVSPSAFEHPPLDATSAPFQSGSSSKGPVFYATPAARRGITSPRSRPQAASFPRRGSASTRGNRGGRSRGGRGRPTADVTDRQQPARSSDELPAETPEGFWHYLIDRHPWAQYVKPRQLRLHELAVEQVSNEFSDEVYRPVPPAGYLSLKFVRSLFPRITPSDGLVKSTIPFLELPSLEDAIIFRSNSADVIQQALQGSFQPARQPPEGLQAPKGQWTSRIAPRYLKGLRPVIYQIVAVKSNSLVLEAKDFFVFMPDRLDLHCILLDKFAFNVENGTYGYDRSIISVKDFVWVYDVMPVAAVLTSPEADLARARIPRTAALDTNPTFFFRVARFAFVTPPVWTEPRYGMVLSVTRRGQYVNNFRMAIEGTPEAVTIARSLCRFEWPNVAEYEILRALCRRNSSCAVRFSEPPASRVARDALSRMVKHFLPANPGEAIVPMEVFKIDPSEAQWFSDRLGPFNNFYLNRSEALTRMGRIFNAASSALAAFVSMDDDKETHRVTATIPSLTAYPLRMEFVLANMNTEAGWSRHRPVGVWLMGAFAFLRMTVDSVTQMRATRELRVQLQAYPWSHKPLLRLTRKVGRVAGNAAFLEACVKLGKLPSNAIPAYEAVTRMSLLSDIPEGSRANAIMNAVYGATPLGCLVRDQSHLWPIKVVVDESAISIHGRRVHLTQDQRQAITFGIAGFHILGIQAAFGTGKTVVGAAIAAMQANEGRYVIVSASTNAAVAQFTETILSLNVGNPRVCRYVAETVAFDESIPTTQVDMHEVLKGLVDLDDLSDDDRLTCERFRVGRERYETYMRNRDLAMNLTEQEREDLILAEMDVSELIDKVVTLLFAKVQPQILAITTSSLLNATSKNGIFAGLLDNCSLLICDEASQIPEPVFAAMASRLPNCRHIYIGDVHQLEPYARCSRHSNPVKFGARSMMDVLSEARAVPMAPLVTTFRAHPNLNGLPNHLAYGGALRSGTRSEQRRLLLDVMRFPNE
ncbi:hypothetical protein GCK32_006622, partial [Trichostrongylus colubriformis]